MKNFKLKLLIIALFFITNTNNLMSKPSFVGTASVQIDKVVSNNNSPWAPINTVEGDHFGANIALTRDYVIQTGSNFFSLTHDEKTAVVSYKDLESDPVCLAFLESKLGWENGFIAQKVAEAKKNNDRITGNNSLMWLAGIPLVAIASPKETRVRNVSGFALLGSIHLALLQSSQIYQLDQRINQR